MFKIKRLKTICFTIYSYNYIYTLRLKTSNKYKNIILFVIKREKNFKEQIKIIKS